VSIQAPPHCAVVSTGSELLLRFGYSAVARVVAFGCLGLAVGWVVAWLRLPPEGGGSPELFGLFLLAVAAIYPLLVTTTNSRFIKVTTDHIHTWSGPLPWRGRARVARAGLEQLLCRTLQEFDGEAEQDVHYLYGIRKDRRLLRVARLGSVDQVLWAEQEIERWLGIEDRRVSGATAFRA